MDDFWIWFFGTAAAVWGYLAFCDWYSYRRADEHMARHHALMDSLPDVPPPPRKETA